MTLAEAYAAAEAGGHAAWKRLSNAERVARTAAHQQRLLQQQPQQPQLAQGELSGECNAGTKLIVLRN